VNAGRDALGELVRVAGRRSSPPHEDYVQVLEAATRAWQRKLRSQRRRRWLYAAAAVLTATGVGVATLRHLMPQEMTVGTAAVVHGSVGMRFANDDTWQPIQTGAAIPAGAVVRTGANGGLALALEGGAAVRVKEQGELRLESAHTLRLRIGTVYVDSGLGRRPASLRIETDSGTVRDVGTIFELHTSPNALRIRVREGRVEIDTPGQPARFQSKAGEQLEIDPRGAARRSLITPNDPVWTWAEALAEVPDIEGRPLLYLLAWVARETGRQLQFQEPAIEAQAREVVLHGKTRDLAPLQALELMLSTTDLEYVLPSDEVIVIRRRREL
jgi:ferric-dicitrate binding protein FerR (iron transport regulator)